MDTKQISFQMFLALWNRRQNMSTPVLHFRMAEWLERAWESGDSRLLLQAFRSSGKSTITGLFAAWLLYRQPDLRILVLAADLMLARKMVRNVKRIIERHPLTEHLKPEQADQWGAERFTIRRELELRDPSMLAKGITTNLTGSRADVVICDDVEVPNTCDTPTKRHDLRERLGEIDYVLVPGGTLLYLGTPHSWYSIYAEEARREIGEDAPFLDGFSRLNIPLLDEEDQSTWPERFTAEDIEQMQRSSGPAKFASQMMLKPMNIAEGRLDPGQLVFYDGSPHRSYELDGLFIEGKRLVSCSAWWDPALGKSGDASVLAVVFTDEDGFYRLQRVAYIEPDPIDEHDEATQQCRKVASIAKLLWVPVITIETNGIGNFLPKILRRELAKAEVSCTVAKFSNSRPKDMRILEAFDGVLAARSLLVSDTVQNTPFVEEMREWRPGRRNGRDDGLDAVAGALSQQPVRVKYERFFGRQTWQPGSKTQSANNEFEV